MRAAVPSMTYACVFLLESFEDISILTCDPTMIRIPRRIAQVCIVHLQDN